MYVLCGSVLVCFDAEASGSFCLLGLVGVAGAMYFRYVRIHAASFRGLVFAAGRLSRGGVSYRCLLRAECVCVCVCTCRTRWQWQAS